MELKELLPIIFERFNASNSLWSLYITVVLGTIAFVAAAKSALASGKLRLVLILAFLSFAALNYNALNNVRKQRTILIKSAFEKATHDNNTWVQELLQSGRPPDFWQLTSFHWIANIVIALLIWRVPNEE